MMLLFKPEHVEPILAGRKTQTRRTWDKPRVKVGGVYQARTSMFGPPFARLRVTGLRRERLGDISSEDVRAEGYETRDDIRRVFERIYHAPWEPDKEVWVIEFQREEESA